MRRFICFPRSWPNKIQWRYTGLYTLAVSNSWWLGLHPNHLLLSIDCLHLRYHFPINDDRRQNRPIMSKIISVHSEIDPLRRVLVHRPDAGTSRISPKRAEELLFDDIVHLPKLQEEHDVFTNLLRQFLGRDKVLEIADLFQEALDYDAEAKREMLELIIEWEEQPKGLVEKLLALPHDELTDTLITGYWEREGHVLFDPIPNFIFTRDVAITVNDHIIISKAAKQARFRENFLTRFVMWAHPLFAPMRKEGKIINLNNVDVFPPSKLGEKISIEGGDVMIMNKDYLLIGASERSTAYGIRSLADRLFEQKVVKNVAMVNVPAERSFMHLDTIFTQIDKDDYVCFKPIIIDGLNASVEVWRADGSKASYVNLKDFILKEINSKARFIYSGGGESPFQEREQWTDACNLVAIKPGVAVTYDRNTVTEKAFEQAGYRVMHANDLLKAFADGIVRPDEIKKTIITLPSSELSRGRGGSHCMTCPIQRG